MAEVIDHSMPAYPVASFFQPVRNLAALTAMGVNVHWGPEVEARSTQTPDAIAAKEAEWIKVCGDTGAKCILKNPTGPLPAHCIGVLIRVDEPNGKGVSPATVAAEADALRQRYPGVPVYLSLAGDKILSANLRKQHEWDALAAYLAPADWVSVNFYSKNRNATRYPTTHTGDVVKTVKAVRPDVKVIPWIEMNDQRLPAPTSQTVPGTTDVNREPTPDEIEATVNFALANGGDGIGWFATCDSGKYGWGFAGDSYWPVVNRNGVSIQPQLDRVAEINRRLNPQKPAPLPETPEQAVARLTRERDDANAAAAAAERRAADALDQLAKTAQALGDERQARKAVEQLHADFVGVMGRMGLRVRGD